MRSDCWAWSGLLLLASCGAGGPRAVEAEQPPRRSSLRRRGPIEDAAREPGRLVLVEASLEHDVIELGEAAVVRRVYANLGGSTLTVTSQAWGQRDLRSIVLKEKRSQGLYEPDVSHLETVSLAPGARVEHRIRVELGRPGSYTIEVPPQYVVRGRGDSCFQLPVLVLDRGDDRVLAEKAERLARSIERESPDCPTCWTGAQGDLQALGKAAVPHLRRWLRESASAHLRAIAAKLLASVKGEEGIEDLVAGLADPVPAVRTMCLDSLGQFRSPDSLGAMLPLTRDPDPWVRVEAVQSIAGFDDDRVLPAMRAALGDEDSSVRLFTAYELVESKRDASGAPLLIELLRQDPPADVWLAATALETLSGRSFGNAGLAQAMSSFEMMEEVADANTEIARRWVRWWDDEGRDLLQQE